MTLRDIDVPARIGGEEFAILLPETDAAGAAVVAARLREGVAALRIAAPDGEQLSVTASFGVASARPSNARRTFPQPRTKRSTRRRAAARTVSWRPQDEGEPAADRRPAGTAIVVSTAAVQFWAIAVKGETPRLTPSLALPPTATAVAAVVPHRNVKPKKLRPAKQGARSPTLSRRLRPRCRPRR